MSRKWIVGVALTAVLAIPVAGWAHQGHIHKVLGTVSAVQANQVTVRTTDGKTVIVKLDQKTTVTRGTARLTTAALKPGERVAIDAIQDGTATLARAVRLSTAAATIAR